MPSLAASSSRTRPVSEAHSARLASDVVASARSVSRADASAACACQEGVRRGSGGGQEASVSRAAASAACAWNPPQHNMCA
eukprot:6735814-Pyramimonas_sp.AAC.2